MKTKWKCCISIIVAAITVSGVVFGLRGCNGEKIREEVTSNEEGKSSAEVKNDPEYFYTDLSGKKCSMNWNDKYEGKHSVWSEDISNPTDYAQVYDDHYYFLRCTDVGEYTIYVDKRQTVGKFMTYGSYQIMEFTKFGDDFFVKYISGEGGERINLAKVDLENKTLYTLISVYCDDNTWDNYSLDFFYDDKIYMIYDEYDQINSTDDKSIYNYTIECLDRNGDEIDSYQFTEENLNRFIGIVDDQILFDKIENDKKILFAYSLAERKVDQVMELSLTQGEKQEYSFTYLFGDNNILIEQFHEKEIPEEDEDDYYLEEGFPEYELYLYELPLNGKMKNVFSGNIREICYNNDDIFYIDSKYKLHKYNKKSQKDKIISDMKTMGVACTSDGLYVKKYDDWYLAVYEECPEDTSNELYFMDFDGKNVKKIMEES